MNYTEAVEYLYNCTPQFQLIGAGAYKPGLQTARELDEAFGHPHIHYPTVHIAGTNGKGSTAHTLAAILMDAGYKVGLYTSPHLVDFRERIRVNGMMISEDGVIDFVERYKKMSLNCEPSFFELTTIMAFDWFAKQGVDVAIIETGLGGRLDTTNIITPQLSVITNISLDHVAQLGNTLPMIAQEKAGIIKTGVPVVIGDSGRAEVKKVFLNAANTTKAPISFADAIPQWESATVGDSYNEYVDTFWGDIEGELTGECQVQNASTILQALKILKKTFRINPENVKRGFKNVCSLTGLMGRWMITGHDPLTVCDTGHNEGGWQFLSQRLASLPRPLSMIIGFVSDKDVDHIMPFMPKDARYIFTRADIPRAMDASLVAEKAASHEIHGEVVVPVKKAVERALEETPPTGSIFIGGSTFIVADYLGKINAPR